MTFNAAMNSIPVLLLAIGVDYGLHVVLRIREELNSEEQRNPQGRTTLQDFDKASRQRAIRQGTVLTSIALMIAITTDIVGFLSFRLSSLAFFTSFRNCYCNRSVSNLCPKYLCSACSHAYAPNQKSSIGESK